jgi:hypothetical protein
MLSGGLMTKDIKSSEELKELSWGNQYKKWLEEHKKELEDQGYCECDDAWRCSKCGKKIKNKFHYEDIKA